MDLTDAEFRADPFGRRPIVAADHDRTQTELVQARDHRLGIQAHLVFKHQHARDVTINGHRDHGPTRTSQVHHLGFDLI